MVMPFSLTPPSHYNSITEPRAHFLLPLFEDLTIDFPSHFITSILEVYLDMATYDKLILPSAIMHILSHFSIAILNSPYFTTMGAISTGSVWWSEALLRLQRPRTETDDPALYVVPSSLAAGVTLEAIMAQLQCMDAHLDTLTNKVCQITTRVSCIARQQARLGGFVVSPSYSLEASIDEDDYDGDNEDDDDGDDKDEDEDASSSNDDDMMTSR